MRRAVVAALLLAGCHHHRDPDAPGLIDPRVPPVHVADERLELPGDPGERMVMLTTGVLGGAFGGSVEDGAVVDLAAEATVSWGENATSHNDHEARLFLPRGVLLPSRSTGVTLGWSGLRIVTDDDGVTGVQPGPIYVEVQRAWAFAGVGGGWAIDPTSGATGPQVNAFYTFYFLRGRALFGGGWELGGGMQLKIPTTWVWSR